jgi:DNA-binding response OmpR family regulator
VLEAGARDYLTKPLDLARLSALLDDVAGGAA